MREIFVLVEEDAVLWNEKRANRSVYLVDYQGEEHLAYVVSQEEVITHAVLLPLLNPGEADLLSVVFGIIDQRGKGLSNLIRD